MDQQCKSEIWYLLLNDFFVASMTFFFFFFKIWHRNDNSNDKNNNNRNNIATLQKKENLAKPVSTQLPRFFDYCWRRRLHASFITPLRQQPDSIFQNHWDVPPLWKFSGFCMNPWASGRLRHPLSEDDLEMMKHKNKFGFHQTRSSASLKGRGRGGNRLKIFWSIYSNAKALNSIANEKIFQTILGVQQAYSWLIIRCVRTLECAQPTLPDE